MCSCSNLPRRMQFATTFSFAFCVLIGPVQAETTRENIDTRHGVLSGWSSVEVEGGFTAVAQGADDSRVDSELVASFDLVATIPMGPGKLVAYLEANTSPRTNGVSSLLVNSNTDAGSALDRGGDGRIQISELHYLMRLNDHGALSLGLIDPTVSLDGSEIANDETSQFLSSGLVNNPTIGFPDYTLGGVYNHEFAPNDSFSLMLTSSNGLADNPGASYAHLVDVTNDEKGVFAAAEKQWSMLDSQWKGGVWVNSADHPELNGSGRMKSNYGVYALADGTAGNVGWNIRLGMANEAVSQTARFAAFAIDYPFAVATIGAGIAHSWLSNDDVTPGLDDSTQAELYARFDITKDASLTPSIQWVNNSGFDASNTIIDDSVIVYGVRMSFAF